MGIDDSRKYDLEELSELYRKAPNSYHRDHWAKIIDKIMRESGEIKESREELIQAIRNGDRRHVRYVHEKLRRLAYNQYGKDI